MQPLFHLVSAQLAPGSLILPGNWGRVLEFYGYQNSNPWNHIRELIFEAVRYEHFPNLPSRLKSVFACPSLDAARNLQRERPIDLIYEVEIVDPVAPSAVLNMSLCAAPQQGSLYGPYFKSQARVYWSSSDVPPIQQELLTLSSLRILRQV